MCEKLMINNKILKHEKKTFERFYSPKKDVVKGIKRWNCFQKMNLNKLCFFYQQKLLLFEHIKKQQILKKGKKV